MVGWLTADEGWVHYRGSWCAQGVWTSGGSPPWHWQYLGCMCTLSLCLYIYVQAYIRLSYTKSTSIGVTNCIGRHRLLPEIEIVMTAIRNHNRKAIYMCYYAIGIAATGLAQV